MRRGVFGFLVLLFIAPYFFAALVAKFHFRLPQNFVELLQRSFLQSAFSAGLAIVLGVIGAAGLLRRSVKWEALAIAPAAVPSIAIVLGFMTFLPGLQGWLAIAFAHACVSSGLVAVVLARIIRTSLGGSLELAWTEGALRRDIWLRGVLPAIREDIVRLALTIFAASLTSFSIPLLLGGSKTASLEIAILQAIRLDNAWDIAAALSLFQMLLLLMLVFVLARNEAERVRHFESEIRVEIGRVLGNDLAFALLFFAPALILTSLLRSPAAGFLQIQTAGLFDRTEIIFQALGGSLLTATLSGAFTAFILLGFAFVYPNDRQRRFISAYLAPSVAITGFSTLAIGWRANPTFLLDVLRISIGSAMLFAPILWRLRFEQRLARLEGQIRVSETLGAPFTMTFLKVLLPQLQETLFWSAGLVSFWSWGDYAVGSISASSPMTLALIAKGLLESYRIEAASVLILVCLLLGASSYRLFLFGGARVAR